MPDVMPQAKPDSKINPAGNVEGQVQAPWSHLIGGHNVPLLLGLVLYVIVIAAIEPAFLSAYNIRSVLLQVSVAGIVTLGMTLIIIAGQIDLSVSFLLALVASVMAVLLNSGANPLWVILVGFSLGIGLSVLTGYIVTWTRSEPFIITLGAMAIFNGAVLLVTDGSEIALDGRFQAVGRSSFLSIPTPIYLFVLTAIILAFVLRYTAFGRRIFAVGENQRAAFLNGIATNGVKLAVYAIHGALVALAAMIQMSRIGVASPNMALGLELQTIAAAVVGGASLAGGKGSIFGSFLGVVLLGVISNSMNIIGVSSFWQYIMLGLVVVVAVTIGNYGRNSTGNQ